MLYHMMSAAAVFPFRMMFLRWFIDVFSLQTWRVQLHQNISALTLSDNILSVLYWFFCSKFYASFKLLLLQFCTANLWMALLIILLFNLLLGLIRCFWAELTSMSEIWCGTHDCVRSVVKLCFHLWIKAPKTLMGILTTVRSKKWCEFM